MMKELNMRIKMLIMMGLVMLLGFANNATVHAAPVKKVSFYEEQLMSDIERVKTINDESKLYDEIVEMESKQKNLVDSSVIVTKKGAKIIDPIISDNTSLMQAKSNIRWERIMELRGKEKAYYDPKGYFMHIYSRAGTIKKPIELKDQEIMKNIIIETLDNIEIEDSLVKDLEIMISGYTLNEMLGGAVKRRPSSTSEAVIIAVSARGPRESERVYRRRVNNTLLHELGHIFEGRINTSKDKNLGDSKLIGMMSEIYPESVEKSKDKSWENSITENFAEDFKTYFAKRLGDLSYDPGKKNTSYEYNEEVEEVFNLYHVK